MLRTILWFSVFREQGFGISLTPRDILLRSFDLIRGRVLQREKAEVELKIPVFLTFDAGEPATCLNGSFRKLGVPHFGVLIIRILLFRVLY